MALILKNGTYVRGYAITRTNKADDDKASEICAVYASADARKAGQGPIYFTEPYEIDRPDPAGDELAQVYASLKKLPEFAGAEDS